MMGRLKSDQGQLFYEFHLGDAAPKDRVRPLSDWRNICAPRLIGASCVAVSRCVPPSSSLAQSWPNIVCIMSGTGQNAVYIPRSLLTCTEPIFKACNSA
jgi:hypothetical protein